MFKKNLLYPLLVALGLAVLSCNKSNTPPEHHTRLFGKWTPLTANIILNMSGFSPGAGSANELDTFNLSGFSGIVEFTDDSIISQNVKCTIKGHIAGSVNLLNSPYPNIDVAYEKVIDTFISAVDRTSKYTVFETLNHLDSNSYIPPINDTISLYANPSPGSNFYEFLLNPRKDLFHADLSDDEYYWLPTTLKYQVIGDTLKLTASGNTNLFDLAGCELGYPNGPRVGGRGSTTFQTINEVFVRNK